MNEGSDWPTDKLTALRLGRRLIAEVRASRPDRRAFVTIRPAWSAPDVRAQEEGWVRGDAGRGFRVDQWEYERERVEGFDYDVGATLVRAADVPDESELKSVLDAWGLPVGLFVHPWETDDPR
ncbi:hypothetical protein ACFW7J_03660 [Streptomyces sp. NPDC059525]|uniref:hypothetical protein n=1 Tax=Streptomyces sp. NPDC059525 TaxID=3346857 RepID=UPI00369335D7